MTDVLTLSENAATLAKQLGTHLASQGSTAELKAIGANISTTADKLSTEIQARRTRKAPAKPALPAHLATLVAAKKAATQGKQTAAESSHHSISSQLPNVSTQPLGKPIAPSPINVLFAKQQAARAAGATLRPTSSQSSATSAAISDTNRKLLEGAAAPVIPRRVAPVYSAPKSKGIFGRALEAAKGALKPSAQQTVSTKSSAMSVADAFKMGGGYRRTRRVRRKNFA